jgi:NAD(P)-dependent dehydrogenase (short-subunit alcohol dehydrogenase family)
MDIRLDGRVALITGGSEGLGKGMALRFAESGADIATLARRPDALNAAKAEIETVSKGKVITLPCDLLDGAATKAAFAEANAALGKIDILVNNAGTSRAKAFDTVTDEE